MTIELPPIDDDRLDEEWTCRGRHVRCAICEAEDRAYEAAYETYFEELAAEREAAGDRLVQGGQTRSDEDGQGDWKITDYRTREVLASGHGTFEDLDAVWGQHPDWYNADAIGEVACQRALARDAY